jgi:WD40 repeat protein
MGLSWMKHHPELVCGAAHSGKISFLKFNPHAEEGQCALEPLAANVQSFPKLSSISVNCSDDFLLASGFTNDLALYDVQTSKILTTLHGAHTNFINISRFAHQSPHIFATASFDHTCKVWDLRQPLNSSHPVKSLPTNGLNIMVTFSADDKYLLSSGVDTRITQWELPSFRQSPNAFNLRAPMHQARYRRSIYFADSTRFVTAATDESHLNVLSTDGRNLGVVDFRGFLTRNRGVVNTYDGIDQSTGSAQRNEQHLWGRSTRHAPGSMISSSASRNAKDIASGKVWIPDGDDHNGCHGNAHVNAYEREYVQSIRTHPIFENQLGVLLFSSYHFSPQSCIALVDLAPSSD